MELFIINMLCGVFGGCNRFPKGSGKSAIKFRHNAGNIRNCEGVICHE
ncbi:protein of unknown function [Xenorhabdus nematophila AN6/1]|nr:protein of unknown function [Xenorhabdus nematophila AN6/1]